MSTLALEIWNDLREKRLVPVAAALVLAIVAVPALLLKPAAGEPSASGAATASQHKPQLTPIVALDTERPAPASSLAAFDAKDPFDSGLPQLAPIGSTTSAAPPSGSTSTSGADDAGSSTGASPPTASGSSGGGGSSSDAPVQDGGSSAPRSNGQTKTTFYTHVVDIDFGRVGQVRERNGVRRLALLPSEDLPLLVFLGVTADAKHALFLVDSSLSQSGEGRCEPDRDNCSFLYLTTSRSYDEHSFTDESGTRYVIRLKRIRRVVENPKGSSSSARSAGASQSASPASRVWFGFDFPLFADSERTVTGG